METLQLCEATLSLLATVLGTRLHLRGSERPAATAVEPEPERSSPAQASPRTRTRSLCTRRTPARRKGSTRRTQGGEEKTNTPTSSSTDHGTLPCLDVCEELVVQNFRCEIE